MPTITRGERVSSNAKEKRGRAHLGRILTKGISLRSLGRFDIFKGSSSIAGTEHVKDRGVRRQLRDRRGVAEAFRQECLAVGDAANVPAQSQTRFEEVRSIEADWTAWLKHYCTSLRLGPRR